MPIPNQDFSDGGEIIVTTVDIYLITKKVLLIARVIFQLAVKIDLSEKFASNTGPQISVSQQGDFENNIRAYLRLPAC